MSVLFGLSFRFSLGFRLRPGAFCRFCGCLGLRGGLLPCFRFGFGLGGGLSAVLGLGFSTSLSFGGFLRFVFGLSLGLGLCFGASLGGSFCVCLGFGFGGFLCIPRGGIAVCSGGEIAMVRGLRHGMVHGGFPS